MTKIYTKIKSKKKSGTRELEPNILKKTNKCMNFNKQQVIHICELPTEVLEKIFDNINVKYWERVRYTCRRLRLICDSKVEHEYIATYKRLSQDDPKKYEFAIMRLVRDMTNLYIKEGFEPIFFRIFLLLIGKQPKLFPPPIELIKPILLKFYSVVDKILRRENKQKCNLLYILTLLGTFKKCKNCSLVSSSSFHFSEWNIIFELKEFWFGLLYTTEPRQKKLESRRNQYDILAILSEVLFTDYSNMNTNFKSVSRYIWEASEKVFLCGHTGKRKSTSPKTTYYLNINGTKTIIDFFKSYYHDEESDKMDLTVFPKDEFDLNVKITCREALNWGCASDFEFHIGSD